MAVGMTSKLPYTGDTSTAGGREMHDTLVRTVWLGSNVKSERQLLSAFPTCTHFLPVGAPFSQGFLQVRAHVMITLRRRSPGCSCIAACHSAIPGSMRDPDAKGSTAPSFGRTPDDRRIDLACIAAPDTRNAIRDTCAPWRTRHPGAAFKPVRASLTHAFRP